MAKGTYLGVNNVARKTKKMYVGVNGVARKVKKVYVGVNGVARLCYSASLHTWEKWDRTTETYYAAVIYTGPASLGANTVLTICESCSINSKTGEISTSGYTMTSNAYDWQYSYKKDYPYGYIYGNTSKSSLFTKPYYEDGVVKCSQIAAKKSTRYVKGTVSYGTVTSESADAYPENGYVGSYWYVYKGLM